MAVIRVPRIKAACRYLASRSTCKFQLLSFCSLLFDNEALTSKSATFKSNNLLCGCVKAIHAVNAVLWQPGEQIEKNRQTNRLTDYYTRGRPRAPRVIIIHNHNHATGYHMAAGQHVHV